VQWERVDAAASAQPTVKHFKRIRGRLSDHDRRQLATEVGKGRVAYWEEKIIEAEDLGNRGDDMRARTLARKVLHVAPASDAARHIAAMSSYRMGRWSDASRDLELLRGSGDASILAVLADCSRALKRHDLVEQLWTEVREVTATPAVVAETRIVMAGSLADRGRIAEAVALLEKVNTKVKKPAVWHFRVMYALADLYDRAGNVQAARRLFTAVNTGAPELTDAGSRLKVLGR
jgi:tetratricopeptide (TPR) repeat protein